MYPRYALLHVSTILTIQSTQSIHTNWNNSQEIEWRRRRRKKKNHDQCLHVIRVSDYKSSCWMALVTFTTIPIFLYYTAYLLCVVGLFGKKKTDNKQEAHRQTKHKLECGVWYFRFPNEMECRPLHFVAHRGNKQKIFLQKNITHSMWYTNQID